MEKETLEEAAERYAKGKSSAAVFQKAHAEDFIVGAEWQADRSYSDTQVYSEIENLIITWNIDGTLTAGALTRQIIEYIKKK